MKNVFLLVFLFVGMDAEARKICGFEKVLTGTEIENQSPTQLPTPIGMNAPDFQSLVVFMNTDPAFAGARGFVFTGSRTNFDYGVKPTEKSDLNLAVFFPKGSPQLEFQSPVQKALDRWAKSRGWSDRLHVGGVAIQAANYDHELGKLDGSPFFDSVLGQGREQQLARAASTHWGDRQAQQQYLQDQQARAYQIQNLSVGQNNQSQNYRGALFSRQSLIYLRPSPFAAKEQQQLNDRGYANVQVGILR